MGRNDTIRAGLDPRVFAPARDGMSYASHLGMPSSGHQALTQQAAEGISISSLERRALDDVALRAGCAMGDPFVCCEPCWRRWVCARIMEHLRGDRWWGELDRGDFGILRNRWHPDLELVEEVLAQFAKGADVLHVLTWAVDMHQPLDRVYSILRTLDMNARRVPRFPWLSHTPPCGSA